MHVISEDLQKDFTLWLRTPNSSRFSMSCAMTLIEISAGVLLPNDRPIGTEKRFEL